MIENEVFIKNLPDIKVFIGDLCREDSLVSNTAFMQGCLWLQNSDPCNYFWDLYLPQILLQWTVQKLSKVIEGCGRHTDAFRKVHNCSLMITWEQGWESAWHSASLFCLLSWVLPLSLTFISDWEMVWTWLCRRMHATLTWQKDGKDSLAQGRNPYSAHKLQCQIQVCPFLWSPQAVHSK